MNFTSSNQRVQA